MGDTRIHPCSIRVHIVIEPSKPRTAPPGVSPGQPHPSQRRSRAPGPPAPPSGASPLDAAASLRHFRQTLEIVKTVPKIKWARKEGSSSAC
jgi:hypothetical protein